MYKNFMPRQGYDTLPVLGVSLIIGCQTYAIDFGFARYLLMAIALVILDVYLVVHWRLLAQRPKIVLSLLMLCMGGEVLNAINAYAPYDAKAFAFRVICYNIIFCGAAFGLRWRQGLHIDWRVWTWVPIAIVWCLILVGLFSYIRNAAFLSAYVSARRFDASDELHPVGLAYGFGGCFVMALPLVIECKRLLFRVVGIVYMLALAYSMALTGSRGALIASVLASALSLAGSLRRATIQGLVAWSVGLVGAAAVALVAVLRNAIVKEQFIYYMSRLAAAGNFDADQASAGRATIWAFYLRDFSSWWLLGYRGYSGEYPHNIFFEFWLRFGILGLATSLICAFLLLRAIMLLWNREESGVVVAMVGVGMFGLINAQFNLALEFNRAFWFGVGCCFCYCLAAPIGTRVALYGSHRAGRLRVSPLPDKATQTRLAPRSGAVSDR